MSIKFGVYDTPKSNKDGEQLQHARLITRGTKRLDEICSFISDSSSLCSADIKGALEALTLYIGRQLSYGYSVELEGLGHFYPALKSTQTQNENGKPVVQVAVDGVNFRCSKRLKEMVKKDRPQRVKRENIPSAGIRERKTKMLDYLSKKEYINASDYAILNSCTRYRAGEDLKQFREEGIISQMGHKTHRIYKLAPQKEEDPIV